MVGRKVHPKSATLEHLRGGAQHDFTAAACFSCNSNHVGKRRSATEPLPANAPGVPDTLNEALAQGGIAVKPRRKKKLSERGVRNAHSLASALRGNADRAQRIGDLALAEKLREKAWALVDAAKKAAA